MDEAGRGWLAEADALGCAGNGSADLCSGEWPVRTLAVSCGAVDPIVTMRRLRLSWLSTRTGRLEVRTSLTAQHPSTHSIICSVLVRSVPPDATVPHTVTVSERSTSVRIGGKSVDVRVFESAMTWIGVIAIDGRWIELEAAAQIQPEDVTLRRIDDLAQLPMSRW